MRIREEKNMLTSLGLIFLSGLLLSRLCRRIGLPHIVGLLLAGILLGPCCLGLMVCALIEKQYGSSKVPTSFQVLESLE